jgi:hypothetical protein
MGRAEDLFNAIVGGGEAAIDGFIVDRQSEELFLDFKRSADNGAGQRLAQGDRANLAKAISGFGNSEGGVLVWGVDCREVRGSGDVAQTKVPIADPRRFRSWLEGAVSGCTVPAHPAVQHHVIETPGKSDGFVATHIAKSYLAPHQTVAPLQYYIRAGSDFLPAPHGVLQGLFGRADHPTVFHMWTVGPVQTIPIVGPLSALALELGIIFTTNGPGLARDIFLNAMLQVPSGPSKIAFTGPDTSIWSGRVFLGNTISVVSRDSFKLSPRAIIPSITLQVRLAPPFGGDLWYTLFYGHGASATTKIEARVPAEELTRLFDELRARPESISETEIYRRALGVQETVPQGSL